MLDTDHADTAFAPHDGHAGKGVEPVLARFGAVGKVGMRGRLGQVQRFARAAMLPTSPSPMAMRVTWTASCASRASRRVRASLRAADRSSRPRCAGFRRSPRPRCSIWPAHSARRHHFVQTRENGARRRHALEFEVGPTGAVVMYWG
jgi:hypothetical protein